MVHFPQEGLYQDVLRLVRMEGDIADIEIDGEIPAEMDGAFYRVHPDPQFAPRKPGDQFFNGDGMVTMFRFKDGRVSMKQRYAKTDKWKLENEAGRALFGSYRNPRTDDPSVIGQHRGTANTNVLVFGDDLIAMKEDSPCLTMDKLTLETDGYTDWSGQLTLRTFGAHPKIDPETGNLCNISYAADGDLSRDATYFEITPDGEVVRFVRFEVPYYTMLHDFGIAGDYIVIPVSPYSSDPTVLEQDRPHFYYDRSLSAWMGVMRRDGDGSDMRWFEQREALCSCHVMNAYQEGTKVHLDTPMSKIGSLPFFPDKDGAPFDPELAMTELARFTVDVTSNEDKVESVTPLGKAPGEFPRIDDRMAGKPYRHGWMITYDLAKPYNGPPGPFAGVINTLTHFDVVSGEEQSWWCGPDGSIQEPCFIPRSKDAPEGDGWLVALVDDHVRNYSDLCIFDALDVANGPIARAKLPIRLRQGLHGNWAAADLLEAA
ncbi:carotenoid oxygenase family protein [Altererythrobacter sp. KTW20L]|uniref:carotenoid oxygenase family protein n=1 Tax=Altererythrobacter sp. KTW20L TaxID=2942210 RepID=UPI0020BE0A0A|nr:carotenoid oxygenase family protein [Altererythrobacter sp. KTW20L]MCL6251312.1 carotenoid oxygenase family protein [Altererythrobacter sp. KTW20L]